MTDFPALFQPSMIDAMIAGRKTMTRRALYTKRKARNGIIPASATILHDHAPPRDFALGEYWTLTAWQKVRPGDRLWVRETHWRWGRWVRYRDKGDHWRFDAMPTTMGSVAFGNQPPGHQGKIGDIEAAWHRRPSIFLPREHSRMTLIVTGTKIEPLQAISEADAQREGWRRSTDPYLPGEVHHDAARDWFSDLWTSINGVESWQANPDVVAVSFVVHHTNISRMAA